MKKLLTKIFVGFFALALTWNFAACSCNCGQEENQYPFPDNVTTNADKLIINKTGSDFFKDYISFNPVNSKRIESLFELRYKINIPDKPYFKGEIVIYTDTLGNILYDKEITGIPDCFTDPQNCEFHISDIQAKSIAETEGLDKGIKDWKIGLLWNGKHKQYLWHILSTLSESGNDERYIAKGKELLIDPSSGKIIELNEWNIR
ncbi:MAG: hypothetical protein Q8N03_08825 [Ignavibacteria bacterium]|nr:hypothetical protein [Ignavibacteria bacterium]